LSTSGCSQRGVEGCWPPWEEADGRAGSVRSKTRHSLSLWSTRQGGAAYAASRGGWIEMRAEIWPTGALGEAALGGVSEFSSEEAPMIPLLKRHEVQVLLDAGHRQEEVAKFANVAVRSVRRIASETKVSDVEDGAERERRGVGRPSKARAFEDLVKEILAKEPALKSLELLRRGKLKGYTGRKRAFYAMVRRVRPVSRQVLMRFEGLPGEFSYHGCGVELRIAADVLGNGYQIVAGQA